MLPIATVQGVKNGISTGMIIDLSDYLKKAEGVTKDEFTSLENTVSGKLDTEPQHKHDISDVKNLREALDSKYDTSKQYPHNVILSDVDKIAYIEAPKVQRLEVAMNSTADGYNFYVDDANGDLMILSPSSTLIASYSMASNSWTFGGIPLNDIANNSTVTEHDQLIKANSVDIATNLAKITAVQDALNTHTHDGYTTKDMLDERTVFKKESTITAEDFQFSTEIVNDTTVVITSNRSLLNTRLQLPFKGIGTVRYWITIGATENDIGYVNLAGSISATYNDSLRQLTVTLVNDSQHSLIIPIVSCEAKLEEFNSVVTETTDIKTKITEMETVLKNHYDALILLLEKHDMIDSNTGDGSNVNPA